MIWRQLLEQQSTVGEEERELGAEDKEERLDGVRSVCGGRKLRFINVASFCSCFEW
jgi:hypothetical protein